MRRRIAWPRGLLGIFPLPFQLELQRAALIRLHRAGAQAGAQSLDRRSQATRWSRTSRIRRIRGRGKIDRSGCEGAPPATQPRSHARIFQQIAQQSRRRFVLADSLLGVDGGANPGPGSWPHRTAGALPVHTASCHQPPPRSGVPELPRKFHQRLLIGRRKRATGCAQNENVMELETFGHVRGHQADRVLVFGGAIGITPPASRKYSRYSSNSATSPVAVVAFFSQSPTNSRAACRMEESDQGRICWTMISRAPRPFPLPANLFPHLLNRIENLAAAVDSVQHRSQRNHLSLLRILRIARSPARSARDRS